MVKLITKVLLILLTSNVIASQQLVKDRVKIDKQLEKIEHKYQIKVGVYAFDTNSNKYISHNADRRFPFQSTCKFRHGSN